MTRFVTSKIIVTYIIIQILSCGVNASRTATWGNLRVLSVSDARIVQAKYPHDEAMRLLRNHEIVDKHSGRKVTVDDNGEFIYHEKVEEKVAPPPERKPDVLPEYMKTPDQPYAPGSGGSGLISPDMMAMINAKLAAEQTQAFQPKPPVHQPAPNPILSAPRPQPVPIPMAKYPAPVAGTGGAMPIPYSAQKPVALPGVAGREESYSYGSSSSSLSDSASYYGDDYLYMAAQEGEKKGSSPWPMLFGMVLMIFIVLSGIGVYFLVVKVVLPKRKNGGASSKSGSDRGPLPPTPDEKGKRRASSSRRASRKPSTAGDVRSVKKKKFDSETDDEDRKAGKSSDDEENPYLDPMDLEENPYLDPSEVNVPGSDYELSQLGEPPAPPSKHYMDEDDTYDDPSTLHGEPDYIEFEG